MYCQLQRIVQELSKLYQVETYGIATGPVTAIAQLNHNRLDLRHDVLYIASQGDLFLLQEHRDLCQYPILCVVEQQEPSFSHYLLSMRTLILVYHNRTVDVLTALAGIMYELGNNHNPMPDSYWSFMSAADLPDLLALAYGFLHTPLFVTDTAQRMVSVMQSGESSLLLRKLESLGISVPNLSDAFRPELEVQTKDASPYPYALFLLEPSVYLLRIPLMLHGRVKGYLVAAAHTPDIPETMLQTCTVLSHFVTPYLRSKSADFARSSSMEHFLTMLLDRQLTDETEISNRLEQYAWKPKQHLYLYVLTAFGSPVGYSPQEVTDALRSLQPDCLFLVYYSNIIMLRDSREELSGVQLCSAADALLPFLERYQLFCGISNCGHKLTQLYDLFFVARKAIDLGQLFLPDRRIFMYEDLAVYHILEEASRSIDFHSILTAKLQRLAECNPELLDTLQHYMKYGCSMTQCAKQMYLHVNTVKYRMNQIMEFLQCDLKDGDTFCKVHLSLKILGYRATLGKKP